MFSGSESTNRMVSLGHKTTCQTGALEVTTLPCLFKAPVETGFESVNVDVFVTNMSLS